MQTDEKLIDYIADLSRLELTAEEKKKYSLQMTEILNWIEQINKADIKDEDSFMYSSQATNNRAEDIAEEFTDRKLIIDNFKDREFDFLKVKKVIE
jgi:aspartyl-tRNA(Asn)/glutamyl-tRNA(Gln) amidotransferase subunit C